MQVKPSTSTFPNKEDKKMKKTYTNPQINYVFMDNDVITASKLYEEDWENGLTITRNGSVPMT